MRLCEVYKLSYGHDYLVSHIVWLIITFRVLNRFYIFFTIFKVLGSDMHLLDLLL